MSVLFRRPAIVALLLALAAELLFLWRLGAPSTLMFDEVHYVPAARTLLALRGPTNTEHPLLAKELIALGIRLFGDGPWGWRLPSTIAGTSVIVGVFATLWIGLGRLRPAVVGALAALLNFTVFIQARIAMLDGFMAAFLVGGIASLLWSMRASGAAAWRRWTLAAALLGLATACKWTAGPYVAFAALAFLALRGPDRWRGMRPLPALAALGGVSVGVYFLTFLPAFFYADDPLTIATLLPFQGEMYARQTQVLPPHAYQSSWWTWPFDLRPIWYLYEPVDGAQRGVLMLGNPAVTWGGLVAVVVCLWSWARRRNVAAGAAAALWLASLAMWAAIPKSLGFFYYYYPSTIWLAIALAVAFDLGRERWRYWDEMFLVLAATLFIHFYPILSAAALSGPGAFRRWMWLPGWP